MNSSAVFGKCDGALVGVPATNPRRGHPIAIRTRLLPSCHQKALPAPESEERVHAAGFAAAGLSTPQWVAVIFLENTVAVSANATRCGEVELREPLPIINGTDVVSAFALPAAVVSWLVAIECGIGGTACSASIASTQHADGICG